METFVLKIDDNGQLSTVGTFTAEEKSGTSDAEFIAAARSINTRIPESVRTLSWSTTDLGNGNIEHVAILATAAQRKG